MTNFSLKKIREMNDYDGGLEYLTIPYSQF